MEEVTTKDGSVTYFNEEFDEYYHSLSGAHEEALEKHVKPVLAFLKEQSMLDKDVHILDFCFGLGYNSFVFFDEFKKMSTQKVRCNALEIDPEIIASSKKHFPHWWKEYEQFVMLEAIDAKDFTAKHFDVCFFDPFSPKKMSSFMDKRCFSKDL